MNKSGGSCAAQFKIRLARYSTQNWSSVLSDVVPFTADPINGADVIVAPNGDVLVAWYDAYTDGINAGLWLSQFGRSTNHGTSFTTNITSTNFETKHTLPNLSWRIDSTMYPKIAVGSNSTSQCRYDVYMVYGSRPQLQPAGSDEADIYFQRSQNCGRNWLPSVPRQLSDDPSNSNATQFFPSIVVDPSNVIHVTYADMSVDSASPPTKYQLKHRQSSDGGVTWQPSQLVASVKSDSIYATCDSCLGDYFDVVSAADTVVAIWTDMRNGYPDIYTNHGSPNLSCSASASPTSGTNQVTVNFLASCSGGVSTYSYL